MRQATWALLAGASLNASPAIGAETPSAGPVPTSPAASAPRAGTAIAASPQPIRIGERSQVRLSAGDPRIGDGEARYKLYRLDAPEGTRVGITMRSSDFDSYLELGRQKGDTFDVIASNDDAGGSDEGLNARLVTTLRGGGPYLIRARGYGADALGTFTLAVEQLPPAPPPPPPIPLTAGAPRSAKLAANGPRVGDDGPHYAYYAIDGVAGQRTEISMTSDAFDSYLELGTLAGDEFTKLASNDDGGRADDHLNARLTVTFPTSQRYIVRARSVGDNDIGAYAIALRQLPPAPPPPRPIPLASGREVQGALGDGDAVITEGGGGIAEGARYYKLYALQGRKGQSVTVALHSAAFDTVLDVGAQTPIGFGAVVHNDDADRPTDNDGHGEDREGRANTDSAATVQFTQSGTILIRVSAYRDGATGAFTLTVR